MKGVTRYRIEGDDRYKLARVLYPTAMHVSVAAACNRAPMPALATVTLYRGKDDRVLGEHRFMRELRDLK